MTLLTALLIGIALILLIVALVRYRRGKLNHNMSINPKHPKWSLRKRFRNFCRINTSNGSTVVGVDTGCRFFGRIYEDPNKWILRADFLEPGYAATNRKSSSVGPIDVHHTYFRFGHWPFSRHYLVSTVVEANIDKQKLRYVMYELRFSGLFGLYRRPVARRRTVKTTVTDIATRFEIETERWREGVDTSWKNFTTKESPEETNRWLEVFADKLGF